MKCTELITQDHKILRRGLDILDGMIQKLENGERIEIADVTAILKFLQIFGDEYHHALEEKVLFPALLRVSPQENSLRQLLLERAEERALIAGIQEALRNKRVKDFVRTSHQFSLLFRSHLDREDAVLRDLADRALSNEEDSVMAAEFRKNHTYAETHLNFARLEWKYAPRPQAALNSTSEVSRAQGAGFYR